MMFDINYALESLKERMELLRIFILFLLNLKNFFGGFVHKCRQRKSKGNENLSFEGVRRHFTSIYQKFESIQCFAFLMRHKFEG